MYPYKSEKAVIDIIVDRMKPLVKAPICEMFKDTMLDNTIEREVLFRAPISIVNSEEIVNNMATIALDTNRSILYVGSQVEATDAGEMRYLFFKAKVDPLI